VKALVCERFSVERRARGAGPAEALREALAAVSALVSRWSAAAPAFSGVPDALAWLDEERRRAARDAGLDARAVVPFALRHESPSLAGLSVEALLHEASSPVHLAAFRCWAWL